jgi:hypothetical protein
MKLYTQIWLHVQLYVAKNLRRYAIDTIFSYIYVLLENTHTISIYFTYILEILIFLSNTTNFCPTLYK